MNPDQADAVSFAQLADSEGSPFTSVITLQVGSQITEIGQSGLNWAVENRILLTSELVRRLHRACPLFKLLELTPTKPLVAGMLLSGGVPQPLLIERQPALIKIVKVVIGLFSSVSLTQLIRHKIPSRRVFLHRRAFLSVMAPMLYPRTRNRFWRENPAPATQNDNGRLFRKSLLSEAGVRHAREEKILEPGPGVGHTIEEKILAPGPGFGHKIEEKIVTPGRQLFRKSLLSEAGV
ncbi:hypothetical protein FF38_03129 [Lucilia cuprina]|uniref:Uncharacterized protein n=1 Tax=Lucilia cuprina TaxID=7375 RepID=A0A0L0C666_LUCCU|nr:hypothetical protein FF38_03129 [Lucilia cuprina]